MKSTITFIILSLITAYSITIQADEHSSLISSPISSPILIHDSSGYSLGDSIIISNPLYDMILKEEAKSDSSGSVRTSKPGSPWFPAPPDDPTPPASAE